MTERDVERRTAEQLRTWAEGRLPLEAAVQLIATACDSRLLCGPWTRSDAVGLTWFDTNVAAAERGYLSGGERRVLELAMSLASNKHPVDLSETICGLDSTDLNAVLAAISHAGGGRLP